MKPRTSGRSAGGADESDSKGSSKSSDELLQNASLALDATIALAPLVPIPALSSVFSCAQIIVETAKKVREDRRAAAELAQQAAEMTRLIHETISGKEDRIDNDLRKALEDFELGLEDVRNIMLEQTSANFIRRLTRRAQFSERLSRCNSRLAYSMRTFSALSQVRLEVKFDELRTEVGQLRKRHDDGYRIYHVGDLAFTRNQLATSRSCSYPYHDQHSTSSICDRCAEISGAVRKGEIKLVKLYRNDAAFRAELDFLKLVRRRPQLPFAQLEGYSTNSEGSLLILTGVSTLISLENYINGLEPIDVFTALLKVSCSWTSASIFLKQNAFLWKPSYERMQINPSGELVIGLFDDIGRPVAGGYNNGCTFMETSIDVKHGGKVKDDMLGMANNLDMSLSVLELFSGSDARQMSFDEAISSLQRSQPSFFIIQGITRILSKDQPFFIGQIRDVEAFEEGYISAFPFAVTKSLNVIKQETHDAVDVFVPFGHEPKRIKQHRRSVHDRMDLDEQAHRTIPVSRKTYSVEVHRSEDADLYETQLASFLCQFGPYLAKACQTSLENLTFVSNVSEIHIAHLSWKDEGRDSRNVLATSIARQGPEAESSSNEAEEQELRKFHIRAIGKDLYAPGPWGFIADEMGDLDEVDLDKLGMKSSDTYNLPFRRAKRLYHGHYWNGPFNDFLEPFYQAAPEVDVLYSRFQYVQHVRVSSSLAAAIQWMHDRFPKEAKENEKLFYNGRTPAEVQARYPHFSPI